MDGTKFILINCYTDETYNSNDKRLCLEQLNDHLVLDECGLVIDNHILIHILGKQKLGELITQRTRHYRSWRQRKFTHAAFPLDKLNELLRSAGCKEIRIEEIRLFAEGRAFIEHKQAAIVLVKKVILLAAEESRGKKLKLEHLLQEKQKIFKALEKVCE